MSTKSTATALPKVKDLVLTRVFDAPRELVWKAWTDPKMLAIWWGPKGFTNPRCEVDVRRDGRIHIDMRGPDGTVYPMAGKYTEVVEPERLAFTSGALDKDGKLLFEFLNTITFVEKEGRTTLTLHSRLLSTAPDTERYLRGHEAGWTLSLEKLAELVNDTSDREIIISRVFDASRELVWEAWTNPKHIAQWWGPIGFTTTIAEMDVRVGGVFNQVMHGPDGTDYPNKSVFTEVVKPERIVFSHTGSRKGAKGVYKVMIWTFEAEGKKTKVTIRQIYQTAADRDLIVKEYNAIEGGKQTLGRLAEYLKKGTKGQRNKGTKGKKSK
jgi:uncharacterized protein YndB with AHSA1/START domain